MPDIEAVCSQCGERWVMSQYVQPEFAVCPACGQKAAPPPPLTTTVKPKLTLKTKPEDEVAVGPQGLMPPPASRGLKSKRQSRVHKTTIFGLSHAWASWILFVLVACAMAVVRYGNVLPADLMGMLKLSAPLIALFFHIVVIWKALEESIFQGMLCLLVPFYSVYYLYVISDSFFIRALVGGIFVGIGEDSFYAYKEWFFSLATNVSNWIQSGGGDIDKY